MTYLSDRGSERKKWIKRSGLGLLFFICFFMWSYIQSVLIIVLDPALSLFSSASSYLSEERDSFFMGLRSKEELIRYIKEVEEKNKLLKNEIALNQYYSSFSATNTTASLVAYAIGPRLAYNTFPIGKGFIDGVTEGMVAYKEGYEVIGQVSSVSKKTSVIKLFSAPGVETRGVIASSSIAVILIGQGGGSYTALIPKAVSLKEGDKVIYGDDERFNLGVVAYIQSDTQDTAQRVFIRSGYSIASLRSIFLE